MDYQKYAKELITYLGTNEKAGRIVQYNISEIMRGELAVLLYLLDGKDGASAKEITSQLDVNTSRVAAILNSLSKKGYIQRVADHQDKRKIHVFITNSGKEFAKLRRDDILNHVIQLLQMLGEEDAKEYVRISRKISSFVQDQECASHNN